MTYREANLPVEQVIATPKTQVRVHMLKVIVAEYAEAMRGGARFPPVVIFNDGSREYILADGHYRLAAYKSLDRKTIPAHIYEGGKSDALRYALTANKTHGLRLNPTDKRRAVVLALKDSQLREMSVRNLADLIGVGKTLVAEIKSEMDAGLPVDMADKRNHVRMRKEVDPETIKNHRPSQSEIHRMELREALKIIKAFPYDGRDAAFDLQLIEQDLRDIHYALEWLGELYESFR